jgi:hypothetical protein
MTRRELPEDPEDSARISTALVSHQTVSAVRSALLDALHILFEPYRGPAVRLFRGANAHEAPDEI